MDLCSGICEDHESEECICSEYEQCENAYCTAYHTCIVCEQFYNLKPDFEEIPMACAAMVGEK